MYKLKYYSLTKDEKQELKKKFYNTDWGKNVNIRLNRLLVTGSIGVIFSILLFIFKNSKWDIVISILLLISSIIFIISSLKVRIKKLNEYLVKNK